MPDVPTLGSDEARLESTPLAIRFLKLKLDGEVAAAAVPAPDAMYPQGGPAWINVKNPEKSVIFAQIAVEGNMTLNVALPPAGAFKPYLCRLVVTAEKDRLSATVQLSTPLANSLIQYVEKGLLAEAGGVLERIRQEEEESSKGEAKHWLDRVLNRFEDPAADVIPRYVEMRLGRPRNESASQLIADIVDWLPDGNIISAEYLAREGKHQDALRRLLSVSERRLPLYTEAFSFVFGRMFRSMETKGHDGLDKDVVRRARAPLRVTS